MLTELNPSGRARCDQGQLSAVLNALDELMCFLNDREVGGKVHVVNSVKSEAAKRSSHLAFNIGTGFISEALAESCTNRGSRTDRNMLRGIGESLKHTRGIILLIKSTDRACNDALTAGNAGGLGKSLIECRSNLGIETAVDRTDRAYTLMFTGTDAAAAKDTLIVVSHEERSGSVYCLFGSRALEIVGIRTEIVCKLLKLAIRAADT